MMSFEEFTNTVKADVEEKMGVTTSIKNYSKLNAKYTGLMVGDKEGTAAVCPIIPLEPFFEEYNDNYEEILNSIIEVAKRGIEGKSGMEEICSNLTKDFVMDNASVRLVNLKMNEGALLENGIIYKAWNDLAIEVRCKIFDDERGQGSFGVTHKLAEDLGIDKDELIKKAIDNIEYTEVPMPLPMPEPMHICSTPNSLNGANVILSEKFLNDMNDKYGNFYILPSSRHEVIIVPTSELEPSDDMTSDDIEMDLLDTVRGANGILAEDEYLSDNIYFYDGKCVACITGEEVA